MANVTTVLHAVEVDARQRLIGQVLSGFHGFAQRCNAQHPAPLSDHMAALIDGTGMEDHAVVVVDRQTCDQVPLDRKSTRLNSSH